MNLVRYLNKQPIRLSAKSQTKNIPFFVIEFDLIDQAGKGLAFSHSDGPLSDEIERESVYNEEELAEKMKEVELNPSS